MNILIASDHAGFDLKASLVAVLQAQGHTVEDLGPHENIPTDDYPDFVLPLAEKMPTYQGFGIVIGGSGQGEAMAANRMKGVRAAVYYGGNTDIVRLAREHNDANVLSLGARFLSDIDAKEAVALFISTPFSGDARHVRRLQKF